MVRSRWLLMLAWVVAAVLVPGLALAADLPFDGLVDQSAQKFLAGKPTAIQLTNGNVIKDGEAVGFVSDNRTGAVKFFQYKDGSRKVRLKASDIYRLVIGGKWYSFRYHRPSGGSYLIDRAAAKANIEARIAGQDRVLREPQTEEEIKEAVADQMQILDQAKAALAPVPLHVAESEFCLLVTDFPAAAATQVANQVDVLCGQMNAVFGIPKDANVWRGKLMVAVLSRRDLYGKFHSKVMNNNNYGTSTTVYFNNARRFMIVSYRQELTPSILTTISWGMSDGYISRYRSNVPLPAWVRAGLHGSLHRTMYPKPAADAAERKRVAAELKRTGSLLGIFDATKLDDKRRPLAKQLVNHLLKVDAQAFSQFFEDLKLGHSADDALKMNYGVSKRAFATDFGRTVGVPGLTP